MPSSVMNDWRMSWPLLNIHVAQSYSFDTWLWLKVWGFIPLNLLFFIAQVPLFMKHEIKQEDGEPASKA